MFTTPVLGRFQQEQGNQGDSDSDGDEAERECDARKNLKETQPELRNKEQGNQGDSDSVCDEAERECDARKNLKETQPELRNKVLLAMCMGLKVHTNNKGWCDPKVDEDYKNAKGKTALLPTADDYKSEIIRRFRLENPTSKDKACSSYSIPRCKDWLCQNPIVNPACVSYIHKIVK